MRGQLRGLGHPSMQIALEGQHVRFATDAVLQLARDLDGRAVREEDVDGAVDETVEALFPLGGSRSSMRMLAGLLGSERKVGERVDVRN